MVSAADACASAVACRIDRSAVDGDVAPYRQFVTGVGSGHFIGSRKRGGAFFCFPVVVGGADTRPFVADRSNVSAFDHDIPAVAGNGRSLVVFVRITCADTCGFESAVRRQSAVSGDHESCKPVASGPGDFQSCIPYTICTPARAGKNIACTVIKHHVGVGVRADFYRRSVIRINPHARQDQRGISVHDNPFIGSICITQLYRTGMNKNRFRQAGFRNKAERRVLARFDRIICENAVVFRLIRRQDCVAAILCGSSGRRQQADGHDQGDEQRRDSSEAVPFLHCCVSSVQEGFFNRLPAYSAAGISVTVTYHV